MKSNTRLRVLRPGDEKFCVTDGPVTTTRAGLEVSNTCPPEMQEMAWMMIANGWISPLRANYQVINNSLQSISIKYVLRRSNFFELASFCVRSATNLVLDEKIYVNTYLVYF